MVYVVQGTTGEYSNRSDWIVCGYKSEDMANEHARKAMLRAKEIQDSKNGRYAEPKEVNEFDPDMQMDYTGTEYLTFSVVIKEQIETAVRK